METAPDQILLLPTGLANPATPWVVLAVCIAMWLALYFLVTARNGS